MLGWISHALRRGRVTTAYPRRAEPAPAGFRGRVAVLRGAPAGRVLAEICPTRAISVDPVGAITLDRARCIVCGDCIRAAPQHFAWDERFETAGSTREALLEDGGIHDPRREDAVRRALGDQARALRRSIHIRHIDTGSDGAEEWEIQALWNPYYDIQRLGFFLTAAPRHADILIVTGGVTEPMRAPLERTWEIMPEPKAVIAAGTDACSGGLADATGLCAGGVDQVLPVDVYVPGSPPSPIALLDGLLQAVGLLRAEVAG
jgi:Ni,Fe-hydrogenase III small subunit/formate hydrogenlyase subunit 6/NADH:ubiquinone oxidoreductase subunit I